MDDGTIYFNKGDDTFVAYEWVDYWSAQELSVPRESVDNSFFSSEERREMFGQGNRPAVLNGNEYYILSVYGEEETLVEAFRFHNGIWYRFSILAEDTLQERNFYRFLGEVSYPDNWDNYQLRGSFETVSSSANPIKAILEMSDRSDDAEWTANGVYWLNLLSVLILFLIPFVISRSIFLRYRLSRKQALLISLIAAAVAAGGLLFGLYWVGISQWFALESIALGLIALKVLTTGMEMPVLPEPPNADISSAQPS